MTATGEHSSLQTPAAGSSARPWRDQLATAIRSPAELRRRLGLAADPTGDDHGFPVLVPEAYLSRMRPGDPDDPLLRQVLPLALEGVVVDGFSADPVGESACQAAPGLLRKYRGRALLVATGACAVHCRYCFRRHYPYQDRPRGRHWWSTAIEHVAADPTIDEVILSGGDPLVLGNQTLAAILSDLGDIAHLRRLRFHTRMPVVLPERVDDALLSALVGRPWPMVMVLHANHPNEIDAGVATAIARLRSVGLLVLNQAVLLAGVNDDVDVLARLSNALFTAGALPYYLHVLDPVAGAAHYAVPDRRAQDLVAGVRERLPGYLVPRLVREVAGASGKVPL